MFKNSKKNLKKLGVFSLVLAQVAAVGIAVPSTTAGAFAGSAITRNMEKLDRGVVATKTSDGVLVSWRRLATEPADTQFTLYRNKEKIAEGAITNFVDAQGSVDSKYTVVCNGEMSDPAPVWENGYLDIPMGTTPESDVVQMDRNGVYIGSYAPGDASYGDLDGDGQYEIVVLWNPSDAKDAASTGQTGKVFVDAYKLDGTQLWRIDMGYNIRAGAHDTQFAIADYNGDGKAEVMFRTADGTIDGKGNVIGDASKGDTYENSWAAMNAGKNLQGPLYVTCFDGETGAALDTIDYFPNNVVGSMTTCYSFGDDFGNRSERYNATVAYIDGQTPSAIFARGYYFGKNISNPNGRTGCAAYSFKNGKLTMDWSFDTAESKYNGYIGQGNHQIEAGDVDGDGKDEILYGALTWDHDGSILWCTYQEHGDAMHLGDFDPTKEGLEFMKVYEDYSADSDAFDLNGPILSQFVTSNTIIKNSKGAADTDESRHVWGGTLQNAKTGEFYQIHNGVKDTGRGMIGNIGYGDSWYVMWGAGSTGYWDSDGNELGDLGASMNGRIYWDGDLQDELQDHNGTEVTLTKWNDSAKKFEEIFKGEGSHSINGTKGNVNAQADLFGDWREEIVSYAITGQNTKKEKMTIKGDWDKDIEVEMDKTVYNYSLRIFETPYATDYNFYTLAHDDIYRNSSGCYANCYNQPPHISWYMNDKIANSPYTTQPAANVKLVSNKYTPKAFDESALPEGGSSSAPAAAGFVDIADHWGKPYIEKMNKAGVINGMDATHFEPEGTVTKGQFATLIVNALKLSVDSSLASEHWAAPYVKAAKDANLIADDIAFTVDQFDVNITRQEMASMVAKAAAYKEVAVPEDVKIDFADADTIDAWATGDVDNAVALGIINGIEKDGKMTFAPKANAKRAEAATMLSKLWDLF
ncbi:MAG: S-layer homology domain-containing protein [Oscillospiraceae bacterium]|nr:S-layer homology domain-containing protein [Oscillospiraceae bacterium]